VCIVGAGAAGLGAARALRDAAPERKVIVVLEASPRVGGRVMDVLLSRNLLTTESDGGTEAEPTGECARRGASGGDGLVVGLGANWLHGLDPDVNPLFQLATSRLGLAVHTTSSDDAPCAEDTVLFDGQGARVPAEEFERGLRLWDWMKERFGARFSASDAALSLDEAFERVLAEAPLPTSPATLGVLRWLQARLAISLAAPLAAASTRCELLGESDGAHGEGLVSGGLAQLLRAVADAPPALDVRLRHAVSAVRAGADGRVRVDCAGGRSFVCHSCVITLPLGVLRSGAVRFGPAAPPAVAAVLRDARLASGLMNVVWLWYPARFWPARINYIGVVSHECGGREPDFTTFLVHPSTEVAGGVLMAQVVGEFAQRVERMTPGEVAAAATAALRRIFGVDAVPEAVGCRVSAWAGDPLARGSWCFWAAGAGSGCEGLGGSDGGVEGGSDGAAGPVWLPHAVLYAGEATSVEHPGTVHGAYLQGLDAARVIIAGWGGSGR
jgi:polyamine oxidase